VTAILKLSARKTDIWVDFEELRKIVGDKKTLQTLGWGTFTSYVKTSHEQKILELRYKAGAIKSVKLLPITAREKYVNSLTPVALALATCPARFRSLVEAILNAGGNDTQAKVLMEDLVTHFIQTPEDLQAFVVRGANVPYWFQQAIEGKWIRSGKMKNGKTWFGLGSKVSLNPCSNHHVPCHLSKAWLDSNKSNSSGPLLARKPMGLKPAQEFTRVCSIHLQEIQRLGQILEVVCSEGLRLSDLTLLPICSSSQWLYVKFTVVIRLSDLASEPLSTRQNSRTKVTAYSLTPVSPQY
jgi:hypothetical protein